MEFLSGQLLVATPLLRDPNFSQTVVLIARHDADGAFGLVLNRPSHTTVKEIWSKLSDAPCSNDAPLYVGGPVQGPVSVLHQESPLADFEVLPGLYFSAEREHLEELVAGEEARPGHAKVFIGYSGWGPNQLESEIEEGAWKTIAASNEQIFADVAEQWERLFKRIAGADLLATLKVKHVPPDPRMN
jgi:putative transcriptional regulator